MIPIRGTIVSDDLKKVLFHCDLKRCKGACCVAGDAGAPLEEEEISFLEDNLEEIRPFMTERGIQSIRLHGVFDYDAEGHFVTPLVNGTECAFTNFENGIAYCSIERSYFEGRSKFRKPISCHLYPVRVEENREAGFTAMNYDRWEICQAACDRGAKEGIPLYAFVREAVERRFGSEFYEEMAAAAEYLRGKAAGKGERNV